MKVLALRHEQDNSKNVLQRERRIGSLARVDKRMGPIKLKCRWTADVESPFG
jgi:hypothetical protein